MKPRSTGRRGAPPEPVREPRQRLVCTVSTVKDTPANITRFLDDNLAAGVDHMVLFLDDGDPPLLRSLADHPHVTAVGTDAAYWRGRRPPHLNARQLVNVNLAHAALCAIPDVAWVFHIDGDERVHVDKQRLLDLPEDVDVVQLDTLEAVSRFRHPGPVTTFKRQLTHEELCLLTALGAIATPAMPAYFRGHLRKPGVRPNLGRRLHIHHVEDDERAELRPFRAPWLTVLHHESHSGEEFVRKWLELASDGTHVGASRVTLRNAIRAVTANTTVTEEERRDLLEALYHRHIEDDEELLARLGFLETPRVRSDAEPSAMTAEDAEVLNRCLTAFAALETGYFRIRDTGRRPADAVAALRGQLGWRDQLLERRLAAALADARPAARS